MIRKYQYIEIEVEQIDDWFECKHFDRLSIAKCKDNHFYLIEENNIHCWRIIESGLSEFYKDHSPELYKTYKRIIKLNIIDES